MTIEIKTPVFPESIADGSVAVWRKKPGEQAMRDDVLAEIETDKVVLEVVAPQDGMIVEVFKQEGDTVLSEEVLASFQLGSASTTQVAVAAVNTPTQPSMPVVSDENSAAPALTKAAAAIKAVETKVESPAAQKAIATHGIDPADIQGTGKGNRITKADVLAAVKSNEVSVAAASTASPTSTVEEPALSIAVGQRVEKRVPMTRLRAKVAERLLDATQHTAMLTTFNEVNMKPIMDMRKAYGERFEKRHGVRLGFMSFFVKAATEALKRFPAVNASIAGNDIIYHGYYDIGVAVSSDRGLVVPVIRNTDQMDMSEIEKSIVEYSNKGRDGKLTLDDLTGGTFTISNGGVFGSLLSTPIINPPQTAILGMHKIQERPMAVNGQVVILPMMYLALSYDHRLIDGKEAVSFLVTLKNLVEDPAMILLDL